MRVKLCGFVLVAVISVLILFISAGCEKSKTEKSVEQKISQMESFVLPQETKNLDISVETVEDKGGIITVNGWAAIKNEDSVNASKYLVLQSQGKTYIFDTFSLWKRPDVTKVYKINRDDSGFNAFIPKDKMERGEYRLGLIIKKGKMMSFQFAPESTLKF